MGEPHESSLAGGLSGLEGGRTAFGRREPRREWPCERGDDG